MSVKPGLGHDLPNDLEYTVAEKDYSSDGYTTSSTGATGKIVADETSKVVFTNTKYLPGSLTIRKTVDGNGGDQKKSFEFTVTFSGSGAGDSYSYTGAGGAPSGTIQGGSGTLSLAHGQSVTFTGLPKDLAYIVTEADYSTEGYTTSSTGATGTILSGGQRIAAFTNTRRISSSRSDDDDGGGNIAGYQPPTPGLEKWLNRKGNTPPTQPTNKLTVRFDDPDTPNDKERDIIITFNQKGKFPYSGSKTGMVTSGDTITLAPGEYIVIEELPEGITYSITEWINGTPTPREAVGVMDGDRLALFTIGDMEVPLTGDDASSTAAALGLAGSTLLLAALAITYYRLRKKRKEH